MDKSQLLEIRIMILHQHLDDSFEDSWKNELDCVITSLKRASKVTTGLRIELSDLNYHVTMLQWSLKTSKRIRIIVILEGKWILFLQFRYGIDREDQNIFS